MIRETIPGLGFINPLFQNDLSELEMGGDGMWRVGVDGVVRILTPLDKKTELIVFQDKTLVYIKSALGYPALYPLPEVSFKAPAKAVLMDLDGTTVHSEGFWVRMIGMTIAEMLGNAGFELDGADIPFVSGHSVSEHLQYCIDKYCPGGLLEEARNIYFAITRREMAEILSGRGAANDFRPSPHLKEFLQALKANGIKIGLVTSGLYEKAWPEIVAAFRVMGIGDPLSFYDCIISAGICPGQQQVGTIGELAPKPHPWLYAETARVGLGLDRSCRNRIIGIEDSTAGIIAIRLAGFAGIGMKEGNIAAGGARPFMLKECGDLMEVLPLILGR